MRAILFLIGGLLVAFALTSMRPEGKKYSCLPCGRTCDNAKMDAAGKCSSCGMELVDTETIQFKTLNFTQLCSRLHAGKEILLLDVRSPEEFTNQSEETQSFGKFKNAVNINITELQNRIGELSKYKNKEVIVYCSHSHRSPQASYILSTHGFTNVSNVAGGVSVLAIDPASTCLKDQFIAF